MMLVLAACADTPTKLYQYDLDGDCWAWVRIDLPWKHWRSAQPEFDEACQDAVDVYLGADGRCYLFDCLPHITAASADPFFGPPCDDPATCCPTTEALRCPVPLNGQPTEVELP